MDITPKYIKQCEKAEEIQNFFKTTEEFDKVVPSFVFDSCIGHVANLVYSPIALRKETNQESFLLILTIEHQKDEGRFLSELEHPEVSETCIWLPRQDQLQEMVSPSFLNEDKFIFIDRFLSFIDSSNRGWSLEQLWLAFVMRERYQKRWDDEKEEWRKF